MAKVTMISKQRVQASTILEVVISMVIIVFVIGIALMILSNVMRLSLSSKQVKANAILQEELIKIEASNTTGSDETFQVNEWRIEKTIKPSELGSALTEVGLAIFDQNNSKIAELKSIIINAKK